MCAFFRTDLAIETAEMFQESEELQGIKIEKMIGENSGIFVTRVVVENEIGSKQLGKSIGTYITLEVSEMDQKDEDYHQEIAREVARQLQMLVPDLRGKKVLVAGVGNRQMAPDALGPLVVDHLLITRHLLSDHNIHLNLTEGLGCVSALAPGVMAQTGMETREIILGAIRETHPEILIIIDALAARSVSRLNKTIQMTDTGIAPGAGIGNRRSGMDKESMGIPVIAIGIPTVIDAASIVGDALGEIMDTIDSEERYELAHKILNQEMLQMFVTPKNIDEIMEQMSFTLSEALNRVFHRTS